MSVRVHVHGDLPGLKALIKRMNAASRNVLVGVPAGAKQTKTRKKKEIVDLSQPLSMAEIAAVHEFGYPERGIPERAVLRGGLKRGTQKFNDLNRDSLRKVVLGELTVEQALQRLGVKAVGEVKREFTVGDFEPLKQATIDRKGSSRPLIDIGQYRQSITYVLEGEQSTNSRVVR